ncbi:hypothetical protein [Virgisporangium ochraceum]|nr:hypothetical protein [Virgisporangium ochraceum]
MSVPRARSSDEAHLFMALHPCGVCGDGSFVPVVREVLEDGVLVTHYTGRCDTCRALRDFRFRIDREPEGDGPRFGGDEPSEIIDAGQWLRGVDRVLAETPSNILGVSEEEWRARRYMFAAAAESVGEVLKFIPAGDDAVPPGAFWTASGREMRDAVPERFERDRLEQLRGVCLELAARFAG